MKWFINYLGASTILNLEGQKINFLLLTDPFIKNPYQRVHKMTGPLSLVVRYIKFLMIHFASCAFKINIKKYLLIVLIRIRFYINVYYLLKMCLNLLLFLIVLLFVCKSLSSFQNIIWEYYRKLCFYI